MCDIIIVGSSLVIKFKCIKYVKISKLNVSYYSNYISNIPYLLHKSKSNT